MILTMKQIRLQLSLHQKRLKAGDASPSLTELAKKAGIHRDTIYAILNGERVSERTQYALSRVLRELEQEISLTPKTKLMSLSFNQRGVSLHIGLANRPLLCKR